MAWQLAAGVGVQMLSGLVGYLVERGADKEADEILERARNAYGELTPAQLNAIAAEVLGPTALSQIQTDPAFTSAQKEALASFDLMTENGGFTKADQAVLARIQNDTSRAASRQMGAITENMAARGVGGSGVELALRQAAAQDAINRQAQAGLDIAGQAQQRYFDAVRSKGDFASRLRSQDYGERAEAARAQDAINRFNVQNRQNVGMYNNQLTQQDFNNRLGILDRQVGIDQQRAGNARNRGQRLGQVIGGAGNTIGGGLGNMGATAGGARPAGRGAESVRSTYGAAGREPGFGEEEDYDPEDDMHPPRFY